MNPRTKIGELCFPGLGKASEIQEDSCLPVITHLPPTHCLSHMPHQRGVTLPHNIIQASSGRIQYFLTFLEKQTVKPAVTRMTAKLPPLSPQFHNCAVISSAPTTSLTHHRLGYRDPAAAHFDAPGLYIPNLEVSLTQKLLPALPSLRPYQRFNQTSNCHRLRAWKPTQSLIFGPHLPYALHSPDTVGADDPLIHLSTSEPPGNSDPNFPSAFRSSLLAAVTSSLCPLSESILPPQVQSVTPP
ncbi:hypothetical protein CRM22_010675 [Opisthorchis felineus]|uniref:Uncharacterized protein n=1 Tax=Opisthorchis felineus TaxID=147828 RepID=A0A4S2KQQ9_OPIFE|nr:hypothetical protein CRM22_010675 [Opisthorchis felineus]